MKLRFSQACFAALICLLPSPSHAHPTPDIPVRTHFHGNGAATVAVEVDPRCLDADPNLAPSLEWRGHETEMATKRWGVAEEGAAP